MREYVIGIGLAILLFTMYCFGGVMWDRHHPHSKPVISSPCNDGGQL